MTTTFQFVELQTAVGALWGIVVNLVLITVLATTIKDFVLRKRKEIADEQEKAANKERMIKYEDTVPFVMPVEEGVVVKVYDGDTITIGAKLPYESSPLYRFSVRLAGIDSPEIKSKNLAEKQAAQISQQALSGLLLNKQIQLRNIGNEKYGRVLADVYLNELHVNEWMISNGYAKAYDGGKKTEWSP